MKQQFVVTWRYTILQQTENTWQFINRPALQHIMFFTKIWAFLWIQHWQKVLVTRLVTR